MVWIEVYYVREELIYIYATAYHTISYGSRFLFLVVLRYQLFYPRPLGLLYWYWDKLATGTYEVTLINMGEQIIQSHEKLWGCYNIGYPYKTLLKLKFREISFVQNIHFICIIIWKVCAEQGNDAVMFYAKFQGDLVMYTMAYGQTRFREIWVWDAFRTDIL